MKHINKLLLLFALMLSVWQAKSQILPPTTYSTVSAGSQTLSSVSVADTSVWYKWRSDSAQVNVKLKMNANGQQYKLTRMNLYTVINDTLYMATTDSLRPDSSMYLYAKGLTLGAELYLEVRTLTVSCGTCTPAAPSITLQFLQLAGCTPYTQPNCQLVKDGGMEYYPYTGSPCLQLQIGMMPCYWDQALFSGLNNGTSDYFNSCAPITNYPNNTSAGSAFNLFSNGSASITAVAPHTGDGYCGFYAANDGQTAHGCHQPNKNYREYVVNHLNTPMVAGTTYSIGMWVRLAPISKYATQNIHMGFSNSIPTQSGQGGTAVNISSIAFTSFTASPITDKTQWTYLSKTYTPATTYSYITIGNFYDYSSTFVTDLDLYDTWAYGDHLGEYHGESYYYVDDVSIVPLGPSAGTSTTSCGPLTYTLGNTANPPTTYTWSASPTDPTLTGHTHQANPVVTPTVTTVYTMSTACGANTVTITILPAFTLTAAATPTYVCPGSTSTLTASGATSYTWLPVAAGLPSGSNSASVVITPSANAQYTVIGSQTGCPNTHTANISVYIFPGAQGLTVSGTNTICAGSSTTLSATASNTNVTSFTYSWQPGGATTQTVVVSPTVTTVYTVTATDALCGLHVTKTYTVNVDVIPNVTVTPIMVCPNGSGTLTATGASSYTWQPINMTGSTVVVSPTVTTTYTVYAGAGACGTVSNTVTATLVMPSITTSTPTCSTYTYSTYTLTASGGSTYSWSPGGSTTASITVTPTVPIVYTVTVNGCSVVATTSLNPVVCCQFGTNIGESIATTSLTSGTAYSLNHTYTITSTSPTTFSNVTIFMGSQAKIVVNNDVAVTMIKTHLLGCLTMWDGIQYAGPKGTISLSRNVLIEDAKTAIDVSQVTSPASHQSLIVSSSDATFNKNYTAISIGTYTPSGYYPSNFNSTVFTCRKLITNAHSTYLGLGPVNYTWSATTANYALKTTSYTPSNSNISTGSNVKVTDDFSASTYSTTNLETPYQNTFSQYGISLNGTGLTNTVTLQGFSIGDAGTDFNSLNLFDNLCYGIYATQANVRSQNCAYQYMRQNTTVKYHGLPMYSGGVGIYAENNQTTGTNYPATLNVLPVSTGSFSPTGNFFFNNPYGIVTANMQYVDIEYAMIHSKRSSSTFTGTAVPAGEYGVYMKNFDYRNINVLNNVAANVGVGVSFYGAYFTKPKTPSQYAGAVSISTNTLQANYPGGTLTNRALKLGIEADNAVNCFSCTVSGSTSSNIITNNNTITNAYSGITSSNWANQVVSAASNTVTLVDNGVSTAQQFGIQHVNNYGDVIKGNVVTGFNNTKAAVQAIRSDYNLNQSVSCNSVTTTYDGYYFTGAANLTYWNGNNMTSNQHGMTVWNTTIGQQGASGSPIYNSWNGTWSGSNFQTYVQGADPATTGSTMYFLSTQVPTYNSAAVISNRYKTTGGTPSLFVTTGVTPSCPTFSSLPVNGHHHLLAFRSNLISMASNSYSYVPYMSGNDQNGLYSVYREIIEDTSLMAGNSALRSLYTDGNSGNYGHFNLAENDLFTMSDSLAQIQVNAMSPSTTVETNTQNFYSLYIKLINNSYTSTDDSTLLALANACPSKDGRVVYQARVLYNAAHDFSQQFYSACDTVTVGKPGHNDLTNSPVNANFIVYPNPNNGNLFLSADNIGLSSYTVRVFDITGKIVMEREYSEGGVKSLSIGAESGIYMVEVMDTQLKTTYRQKIVIQK